MSRPGLVMRLMILVAASLVVTAALHRGREGVAETVIAVVLLAGAVLARGGGRRGRTAALAATGVAIAGFLVGLRFTIRAHDGWGITYHAAVLPVLAATFLLARGGLRGCRRH